MRPRTWKMPGQRRRQHKERGAEMVEFAFVVVLLIALLYGIIPYGLILSAQSTVTQAAADGARAGIVAASSTLGAGPQPRARPPTISAGWTRVSATNPITSRCRSGQPAGS